MKTKQNQHIVNYRFTYQTLQQGVETNTTTDILNEFCTPRI